MKIILYESGLTVYKYSASVFLTSDMNPAVSPELF